MGWSGGHVERSREAQQHAPGRPHGHAKLRKTNVVADAHPDLAERCVHRRYRVAGAERVRLSAVAATKVAGCMARVAAGGGVRPSTTSVRVASVVAVLELSPFNRSTYSLYKASVIVPR